MKRYTRNGAGAGHIVEKNGPAVAHEVILEAGEFAGEAGSVSIIHQQDDFTAGFNQGQVYAGINVTVGGVVRRPGGAVLVMRYS